MAIPTPKPPVKWRDVLPVHPAADLLPLMAPDELQALADDIKLNGLRTEITVWSPPYDKGGGMPDPHSGALLDGRNRLDALELAGVLSIDDRDHLCIRGLDGEARKVRCLHLGDGDPYDHAVSLNILRRHLTPEQKRELIATLLRASPTTSDRQIANTTKTSDKTVATVRRKLEARAEIPNVEIRTDTKGRAQPATKKIRTAPKPVARKRATETAARQQHASVPTASEASELLRTNPIDDAWVYAPAVLREQFVQARWTDIMRIHLRLGGADLPTATHPEPITIDAAPTGHPTPKTKGTRV